MKHGFQNTDPLCTHGWESTVDQGKDSYQNMVQNNLIRKWRKVNLKIHRHKQGTDTHKLQINAREDELIDKVSNWTNKTDM